MNGGVHMHVTFQTCASCGDLHARPGSYKLCQRRRGGVPSHKRGASRVSLEAFKLDSKVEEEIRAFERSLVGGGGAVKWKLVRETTHLGVPSAHSAYPVIRYVSFLAKLL